MPKHLRGTQSTLGGWHWQTKVRPRIIRRDRWTCQLCGRITQAANLDVDHIVPRHLGGTDAPDNLRTLCRACHRGLSPSGRTAPLGPVVISEPGESPRFRVHDCRALSRLPTIRGDTRLPRWEGEGCPPECPYRDGERRDRR